MNALEQFKKTMNDFNTLVNNKGEFFVSRKSVNHNYRMGLRFKGLTVEELGMMKDFKETLGYSFVTRDKSSRCISNQFVKTLVETEELKPVYVKSVNKYPQLKETFELC